MEATTTRKRTARRPAHSGDGAATAAPVLVVSEPPSVATYRDRHSGPRYDGFRASIDKHAAGFDALLGLLAASCAEDAPCPWFLDEMPGVEGGEDDPIHTPAHVPMLFGVDFSADDVCRLTADIAEVMSTRAYGALVSDLDHAPEYVWRAPRLGYHPEAKASKPSTPTELAIPAGWVTWQCDLTERFFAMPKGLAPLVLFYDVVDGSGNVMEWNHCYHVIHPALALSGANHIVAAMWDLSRSKLRRALEAMKIAVEEMSLVIGLQPSDLPVLDLAPLLRAPGGWIDVDCWHSRP